MFDPKLKEALSRVQKPGRYTGGEPGSVYKNKDEVDVRFAFCFPDTYEVGMSFLGEKILYELLNSHENWWCERAFMPWLDMKAEMERLSLPLYTMESKDPLTAFDAVGFTLQYELSYTNILAMLDLAGIPFPLSSPYRCPKHNRAVGGVPTSAHTRGYAVDIRCVDSHSRFVMLQALLEAGFRRIELAPTWIHVDNDPDKPRDVAFYQHGGKY
jgi:hypothetical protein